MKKCVMIFILFLFLTVAVINAQTNVSVSQVQGLSDYTLVMLRGNIVQQSDENRYLFRDTTGQIDIIIPQDRWGGLYIAPSDLVEAAGELRRNERTGQVEVHVNSIARAATPAAPASAPMPFYQAAPTFTPAPFAPAAPAGGEFASPSRATSPLELPAWQSGRLPVQGNRTGFFAGLELGMENFPGNEYIQTHFVAYRNAFSNGAFIFYGGIYHSLKLSEDIPRELSLELSLKYNIFLGSASTLSLFLENDSALDLLPCQENYSFHSLFLENDNTLDLHPCRENCFHLTGSLQPGISFISRLGSGNIYSRLSTPFTYSFDTLDLTFTLGWSSDLGLGFELSSYSLVVPNTAYNGFDINIHLQHGTLFSKITLGIPSDLDQGLFITPELKFTPQSGIFSLYAKCDIGGISSSTGGLHFYPVLGIMFNLRGAGRS